MKMIQSNQQAFTIGFSFFFFLGGAGVFVLLCFCFRPPPPLKGTNSLTEPPFK